MEPPYALISAAPPSETALLDFARARVSREMIHEIALNDRGDDAEIHELAILKQLAPAPTLGLLPWHPLEVLELQRWSEPDQAYTDHPPEGSKGHLKRLFACTILLRNVAFVFRDDRNGEFFVETSAATVFRLVLSCIALGSQFSQLALGFLLWLHAKQSHPMLRPFVSFGVLLFQIQEDLARACLMDTCAWVEAEENSAREQLGRDVHSARWLIGLSYQEDHSERRAPWTDTFAQLIAAGVGQLPPDVARVLQQMLNRLAE
jgi:hypothetical protein